ncbi:MAG: hypothetical protein JJE25_14220 [Bacteroidia bacterium]|nr:hypothetical protein [Bacteroidia bacterium]
MTKLYRFVVIVVLFHPAIANPETLSVIVMSDTNNKIEIKQYDSQKQDN